MLGLRNHHFHLYFFFLRWLRNLFDRLSWTYIIWLFNFLLLCILNWRFCQYRFRFSRLLNCWLGRSWLLNRISFRWRTWDVSNFGDGKRSCLWFNSRRLRFLYWHLSRCLYNFCLHNILFISLFNFLGLDISYYIFCLFLLFVLEHSIFNINRISIQFNFLF